MRDLMLLFIFGGGSLVALRRPWVGVMLWTVISLMNPHAQWGYAAANWPLASGVAAATLIGLLLTRERHNPFVGPGPWVLLLLCAWVTLGLYSSFYLEESLPLWERSMKIWLMIFVMMALVDDRGKLNLLIALTVFSVGFYGVKGGVFTIATAGSHRVWGPGGFIGGNNEVGLALLMVLPLMRYLQLRMDRPWQRHLMSLAMLLTMATVLGTWSRGALLGIAAVGLFLWLKSSNKVPMAILLLVGALAVLPMMPDAWWQRMQTIETYEEDASATGRINAWINNWNLAKSHLFGGGFMIYKADVFARFAPEPDRIHAAHSIYFQMIGEHGFMGLLLFLGVGLCTWVEASRMIRIGRDEPALKWAADLGQMVHVSLIAFAVTGAFLSLAYYDLPYYIMAIAALGRLYAQREAESIRVSPHPPLDRGQQPLPSPRLTAGLDSLR